MTLSTNQVIDYLQGPKPICPICALEVRIRRLNRKDSFDYWCPHCCRGFYAADICYPLEESWPHTRLGGASRDEFDKHGNVIKSGDDL